jgi:hypothetical protein
VDLLKDFALTLIGSISLAAYLLRHCRDGKGLYAVAYKFWGLHPMAIIVLRILYLTLFLQTSSFRPVGIKEIR